MDKQDSKSKEKTILVYDLGGGTFDVSLLTIDEGVFEVLATSGDTHLGGEDFDNNVLEYFLKKIKKDHPSIESTTSKKGEKLAKLDSKALQKLRREIEKAKRTLSTVPSVALKIDSLFSYFDKGQDSNGNKV